VAAKRGEARERILENAEALLKHQGAESMSIEAVAAAAGSAKGLVHYHFKTKQGLMSAVAERLTASRKLRWETAFKAPSAQEAILQTWSLLTEESGDGTVQAWQSLVGVGGRLTDGTAKTLRDEYSSCLCDSLTSMLRDELGLTPTIPTSEIGRLLEAVIHGMGFQLASGTEEEELEGAYSAAWLSILSLTQPST
jgi:AcrR family transcriptional regulator